MWSQTDLEVHEAWGRLCVKRPVAAGLLHCLVKYASGRNAVVIGQQTLADLLGVSDRSVRTAISQLEAGNWIQVVRVGKGRECAYVVNRRVSWTERRGRITLAAFSAEIIADKRDQDPDASTAPLRRIPTLMPGERQLPSGAGEPPPSQPYLEGVDPPDLPAIERDPNTADMFGG